MQKYDESDQTNLRKRKELKTESKSEEGNASSEKKVDEQQGGEKLKRESSESILEPLTEKLDDIAEKLDKERIEAEAKWEKSQRELEEVN